MAIALTELENCVLGAIRQLQPCSAYAVRQVFAKSTTPDWSGSSGSIYPVVERLIRRGLVAVEALPGSRRGRRNLTATEAGEGVVRAWINGLEPQQAMATPDPIRTRMSFLDLLPGDADRLALFDQAIALTSAALAELGAAHARYPQEHYGEYMSWRGAVAQLEARLAWLHECRRIIRERVAASPE